MSLMALQLSEIISYTRSIIDETAPTAVLLDSEVQNFINHRYHQIEDIIKDVNEDYFGTTGTVTLANSTELYNLPQDSDSRNEVDRILRVEVAYDNSNYDIAHPITIQRKVTTESNTEGAYSERNPRFYIFGNQIGFLPIPTGTGTAKIWYIKRLGDLENTTDIPELPDKYHRTIAYGAAIDALRKDDYLEGARSIERDYEKQLRALRGFVTPRINTGMKHVKRKLNYGIYNPENYIREGTLS